MVEDLHEALTNKVHFLNILFVPDHLLILLEDATEHVYYQFVRESALTLIEEVVEGALELLEDTRLLYQFSLHLRRNLLVEGELLNDKVEIVEECLLYVLSDVSVQSWLDMKGFVGFLNFLYPHIERIELLLNQIIKVVRCTEDTCD